MNDMNVYKFDSQEVRVVAGSDGEPWFVAADVCKVLDQPDTSKVCSRLDEDEKGTHIMRTPGGSQEMTVINESGLYSLILTSRKAEAKRFKKWVTSEVLPSIRKTGSYSFDKKETKVPELIDANALYLSDLEVAKTFLEGNQAILSANVSTRKATGIDILERHEAKLISPVKHQLLNVTSVGKQIGATARETNLLLEKLGLQISMRDDKGNLLYDLTDKGKDFGEVLDTTKKHNDGTPIKQLKWYTNVIEPLLKELN